MIVGVDEDVDKVELPRVDWYVDGLEKRIMSGIRGGMLVKFM